MKDKFNRELLIGDICFRVKYSTGRFGKPSINVVKVQDFTESKVKIAERCFVDSNNLVKATHIGLEQYVD